MNSQRLNVTKNMDTLYSVDREIVKVGDIVMLNDWVGCSADCRCGLKKLPKFLKRNTKYIVKGLTHFGGGCPFYFILYPNTGNMKHHNKGARLSIRISAFKSDPAIADANRTNPGSYHQPGSYKTECSLGKPLNKQKHR